MFRPASFAAALAAFLVSAFSVMPASADGLKWWERDQGRVVAAVTDGADVSSKPDEDGRKADDDAPATVLDSMRVTGGTAESADLPGSGVYLGRETITTQGYGDINQVLRQIPGVYVRGEDGYGLFPNISLRGVDPGRSAKLTLMEDGILTAPAPYSAPEAYYSPNVGRMAGLEVLKGSSQVRFGPHSTGGVINYLSTPIPDSRSGQLRSHFGADADFLTHGWFGETTKVGEDRFGWLVEGYFRETDGFKELDPPRSSVGPDAENTGFRRSEPMIKLAWEPAGEVFQRLEFKYGTSDLDANETYLGLSDADFKRDPYRRYAGSRFDNIKTAHERLYLRHFLQFENGAGLTSTVYRNDFHRNWFKIRAVDSGSGSTGLGAALSGSNSGADLDVLRGDAAGTLHYRNNNREYYLQGADLQWQQPFHTGSVPHTLRAGLRFHQDRIFRFQNDESYTQDAAGLITGHTIAPPGSQANREQTTDALSLFIEDRISFGNFYLTPGVRIESLDWHYEEFDSTPVVRDGDRVLTGGGLGFNWTVTQDAVLFGGVYRGFSPPSPSNGSRSGNDEQKEETSISGELGVRLYAAASFRTELVAFATRFRDLIVSGNLGASGNSDGSAVGRVDSRGLELALRYDPGAANGWAVATPLGLATTYTRAEIGNDSNSDDAESIFNGGREGARLPYIPEWQVNLTAGVHGGTWTLDAALNYVDESFATALNTDEQVVQTDVGTLSPDARGGIIDSFVTLDLSASFQVNPAARLFVNAQNVLDETYVASRLPEGPRPGAPRTAVAGIELTF